jgi:hypothetical protein
VLTGLSPNTLYHYRLDAVIDGNVVNGADKTFTTSTTLGVVSLQGTFGELDIDTTNPAITSFTLRNPDGSMPTQSLVGNNGTAQTSITNAATGQTYQSSQVSPTKVVVTKNGQGVVTGVFLGGIAVVPGQETENWNITTADNGQSVQWTVTQHWTTRFAGSADTVNLPFSSNITGTMWYQPSKLSSPQWDSNPNGEVTSVDSSETVTKPKAWLIDKLDSPYDLGSDLRLAVSGGYIARSTGSYATNQVLGATLRVGGNFSEPARATNQMSLTLSGVNKYATGEQLDVTIPDTTTQTSLQDMYDSVLNGGSVAGQMAYQFGNEVAGVMSGYGALYDEGALSVGMPSTGSTGNSPYSVQQAMRGYLQYELQSVNLSTGQIAYGISGTGGYQDVELDMLIGLYQYSVTSGDLSLFREYLPVVEASLKKWIGRIQSNGLVLSHQSDGDYDDADFFGNSYYGLYENDYVYEALTDMSQLVEALAAQAQPPSQSVPLRAESNQWAADATVIKNGINTVLWSPNSPNGPMYTDWINLDSGQRYYIFTAEGQYPAIIFGIASHAQAVAMLSTADARLSVLKTQYGYTDQSTLATLWPQDSTTDQLGFGYPSYFNGGSFTAYTYYEVMARAMTGDTAGAYQLLKNFAADYASTSFWGSNWVTINGTSNNGGEPYLEDMVYTAVSLVQGILGINQTVNGLVVTPHLPAGWSNASATVLYKGQPVCVTITQHSKVSESRGHC